MKKRFSVPLKKHLSFSSREQSKMDSNSEEYIDNQGFSHNEISSYQSYITAKKIESIWDIENHYWYPLTDCKRSDVVAFDEIHVLNCENKISDIKNFILKQNKTVIFEMNEYRHVRTIKTNSFSLPKNAPSIEIFWFDEDMNWIIYLSHEGSITFGGNKLIFELKEKWQDWDSNIFLENESEDIVVKIDEKYKKKPRTQRTRSARKHITRRKKYGNRRYPFEGEN